MSGTISIQAKQLTATQRETLQAWADKLRELTARQRACPQRTRNASLSVHLTSALRGTYEAIAAAAATSRGDLIKEAMQLLSSYVRHLGDARQAALQLPAFSELNFFLRGPEPAPTLLALAEQAEAAAGIAERVLAGKVFWSFPEEASR